ncbi:MAG: hypothetical protein K8R87_12715 [Verrucomicrobia bacterium]|nr:hypothetical protein [Verrucomicrobiota bacterium]
MNLRNNLGTLWLVNQFAPPDRAPTARLLGELAVGLKELGWQVRFIACPEGYRTAPVVGWRRLWRDLKAHIKIFRQTLTGPKPDIVICLSDPPALVFTMACTARLRRAKLVYWPMDVYPEIAAALGALSDRGPLYRVIKSAVDWALARCASVVCLDQDMCEKLLGGVKDPIIAPWPPSELVIPEAISESPTHLIRWTYSGNLGRAHEYEALLRAQRLLEDEARPFELVFQGGGAARKNAEKLAAELALKNCRWLDYADDTELVVTLLQSHVCIATQRPEMLGLLWPSKLALLEMLPRPIIWVGPLDGAISRQLRKRCGLNGVFDPGDYRGLALWLAQNESQIRQSVSFMFSGVMFRKQVNDARTHAISSWHQLLASLMNK